MKKLSLIVLTGVAAVGMIGCSSAPTNTVSTNAAKNGMTNANTATVVNNNVANANGQTIDATNGNMSNMGSKPMSANPTDASGFMMAAAESSNAEIAAGKMAVSMSKNAEVKQFAQQMIAEHTKANNDLKPVAAKKNVVLPTDISAEHKEMAADMASMSGVGFDKDYMTAQVADHEKTVALLQSQIDNGTDADAKAFATKMLPAVKMHLEMARKISAKLK
jgi:putative membrane protein